jgi:SAM-dependent methyltransferase
MEIHQEALSDVDRYVQGHKDIPLEQKEHDFDLLLRYLQQFITIDSSLKMLEVGTGMGWVPIIAKKRGWNLTGVEIAPGLIEAGREYGRRHGYAPDLILGNIETYELGENVYDVIIANSVFEHVENWQPGLDRLYRALKPGGYLFFESTSKWSITSGELPAMPCYGWMPNWMRYRFRMALHGADIMKNGIDFHQFTYPGLRSYFKKLGFQQIHDRVDLVQPEKVANSTKRRVLEICKKNALAKFFVLTFFEVTTFVCKK